MNLESPDKRQTESGQAQAAPLVSERRLLTLLRSIGDAVIAADTHGRVTFMNAAAEMLTGWTLPEASGKPLNKVYHIVNEVTRREVQSPVEAVLRDGRTVGLADQTILVARDGTETPIDDSVSPIRDDGELTGVVLVFRDITERRQAADQIAALNARLHQSLRQMQDRVRNNLQRLVALVDSRYTEKERPIAPDELRQLGLHIHMLAAVNDILMRQSIDDGTTQHVSARLVLERLLPMLQETNRKRRIHADIEDVEIWARQANALAMVVNELVMNALKFSKNELYVRFRAEEDRGVLEVRDDGPGLPPDFDPYHEDYPGLELVNSLSRLDLGGRARYVNQPQGGARITIIFPLPD